MKFLTDNFRRRRPGNSGDGLDSRLVLKAQGSFTPLRRRLVALKTWPLLLLAVGLVRAEPPVAPKTARDTARASNSVPTKVPTPHRLVIEGEPMVVRTVTDTQQGGLAVGVLMVPEKWRFNSQVSWTYENYSSPVKISVSAENPDNEEAYYGFPALEFFCLRPRTGFYRPWQNCGGMLFAERQPPSSVLEGFVRQARSRFPKFEIIGFKELPELAAALQIPKAENQRGIGLKVTYELKGTLVEEEFYAIGFSIDIPYDGPQGRTWQNNWGLYALHSFRAPQGG